MIHEHWEGQELERKSTSYNAVTLLAVLAFFLAAADMQGMSRRLPATGGEALATNQTFDTNIWDQTGTDTGDRTSAWKALGSLFLTLLLVGVIGAGLYFFLKYISRKQAAGNVNSEMVRVVVQNTIGAGRFITVVRIMESFYILAVSENQVSLVREVTSQAEVEILKQLEAGLPAQAGTVPFGEYLNRFLGKPPAPGARQEGPDRIFSFLKKQKKRLKKMNGDMT